jgi:effector-binding domain-containing protein
MAKAFAIDEVTFPEASVLALRAKESLQAMGKRTKALFRMAAERGLKPAGRMFAVYYEKPEGAAPVDYALILPVAGAPGELDKLEKVGGDRCVHLRVSGSYSQFGAAYAALVEGAAARGLELSGPPREVYTRGPLLGFMTFIPTMVTDIYFPVAAIRASPLPSPGTGSA